MKIKTSIKPLTPKQKAIVDFISKYHAEHGYSPSLEEIANEFHLKAISTVHQHIALIEKKGYLTMDAFQKRSILPLPQTKNVIEIPILGQIAAGDPIEAIGNPEPIAIPATMLKGDPSQYYALKVKGNSMIEDNVWDGDLILIKHQENVNLGEMIVAVVDNNVTLKRYGGHEQGKIKLVPKNPSLKPYYVDANNFEVRGKFVGLLRRE